jgi:hypothetical protein
VSLELTRSRQQGGVATLLDLRQAEQLVDTAAVGRITTARDLDSIVLRQVRDVLARVEDHEIMPTHAVIWIDHKEARIFHVQF